MSFLPSKALRYLPLLLSALAVTACSHPPAEEESEKVAPVEVAEAQTAEIHRTITGEGVLYAINQATVVAKIAAPIGALHVKRGDRVKKGQLLAELEARDLNASAAETQALVAQAESAIRAASADLSRATTELSKAQADLTRQQAALNKDMAELNRETAALAGQTADLNSRKASTLPEEIRKAALDVERATAAVDASKRTLDAREALFKEGALSRRQVEEANLTYVQAHTERDTAVGHLESLQKVGTVGQEEAVKSAEAQVQSARAQVEAARAQVEVSRAEMDGSKAQVEGARAQVEAAKAQEQSAKSQLDAARARTSGAAAQVSYSRLVSPIDGVISDRPLFEGEMTGPDKPALTVMDITRVIARVNVPSSQLAFIKVGDTAEIDVTGAGKVSGKVTVVGPAVDPGSTTAEVWVEIDNRTGDLHPGSVVRASILAETVTGATVVPTAALLQSAEGDTIVLVVGPAPVEKEKTEKTKPAPAAPPAETKEEPEPPAQVVHERKVQVGIREPSQVQILDGVKPGELVVISGGNGLEDGAKIKVIEEKDEDEDEGGK